MFCPHTHGSECEGSDSSRVVARITMKRKQSEGMQKHLVNAGQVFPVSTNTTAGPKGVKSRCSSRQSFNCIGTAE